MKRPSVVVITGASIGLGRAMAREFARKGARIGLIARDWEGLEAAKAEVEKLGGVACIAVADVAKPEELENAVSQIEASLGAIDVWVNNAMASVFCPWPRWKP